ncbi:ABC transporter permease [Candidatus Acetothermia bacterium]|nr:MAG: ABC transporter permease [Candidatus Acetothermia bacterium]
MGTKWQRVLLEGLLLCLVFFLVFGPISSLVIWSIAIRWYWPHVLPQEIGLAYWKQALGLQRDWAIAAVSIWDAFGTSILVAVISTALVMTMAIPAGYALARFRVPLKALILLLFLMPKAFPQQPIFVNLLPAFTRWGLAGTVPGVILIHILVCLIFGVWITTSAFKAIPQELEEAARSVGATRWCTFWKVLLPLAAPGLLVSTVFVFITSLTEFTGTFFIGLPFVTTLPMLLYSSSGYNMQFASVIAIVLLIPSLLFMVLIQKVFRPEYMGGITG